MYKVTLYIPGVAIYRLHKLEDIPLVNFRTDYNVYSTFAKAAANKHEIITLSYFLCAWDQSLWAKRIESNSIDLYTNDKSMYDSLLSTFENLVRSCSEPDEANKSILENTGSVVVKRLPHNKYQYKAFLLPHKVKNREEKQEFINWLDTQGERVLISKTVKDWFVKTDWNWDRRYILVEDERTLLMVKLRKPEALGRIYDYVVSDK
jgi:hypothetical protein